MQVKWKGGDNVDFKDASNRRMLCKWLFYHF